MNNRNRRSRTATRLAGAAVLAAGMGAAVVATAGPASATPVAAASSGDPVIVGPLLNFFAFGDNIGIPLVCGTGAAALGDGAAQYGLASQASTLVNAINDGCGQVSTYGGTFIAMGQADDGGAAALAPVADPALSSLATSVQQFATDFGSTLNPFGATIYGSSGDITWLEGH